MSSAPTTAALPAIFSRLELLVGAAGVQALQRARVLVCGLGGVGSWGAEALCRGGIGSLTLVDFDTVKESNLNRQLLALHSTLGAPKAEVLAQRLRDINPAAEIISRPLHLHSGNIAPLLSSDHWDFVLDAIDERQPKIALLKCCWQRQLPVISSLGAASKLDPSLVTTADLSETYGCPLARNLRKALKKEGIERGITVVYSPELPILPADRLAAEEPGEKSPLGSISYMPPLFGFRCAAEILRRLLPLEQLRRRGETPRTARES